MVNVTALDVPPPGAGVNTVIAWVPPSERSAAPSVVTSDVALTNVVARLAPSTRITEFAAKFVPVAVNVNALGPTAMLVGVMLVNTGTGGGAVAVNVAPL